MKQIASQAATIEQLRNEVADLKATAQAPRTPPRSARGHVESPIRHNAAPSPFSDSTRPDGDAAQAGDTPNKLAAALDAIETASAPYDGRERQASSPRSRSLPRRRGSLGSAEPGVHKSTDPTRGGTSNSVNAAADDSLLSPSGTGASLREAYTAHIRMLVAQLAEQEAEIFLLRSSLHEASVMTQPGGKSLADDIPRSEVTGFDGSPSRLPHPTREGPLTGSLISTSPGGSSASVLSEHTSPDQSVVYMDADYLVDGEGEHWYCMPDDGGSMQRVPTPDRRELVWSGGKVIDTLPPRLPASAGSSFEEGGAAQPLHKSVDDATQTTPVPSAATASASSHGGDDDGAFITADVSGVHEQPPLDTLGGSDSDGDRTASIRTVTPLNPEDARITSDSNSAEDEQRPEEGSSPQQQQQTPLTRIATGGSDDVPDDEELQPATLLAQSSAATAETPVLVQPSTAQPATDGWSESSNDSFDDTLSASTVATAETPSATSKPTTLEEGGPTDDAAPGIGGSAPTTVVLSPLDATAEVQAVGPSLTEEAPRATSPTGDVDVKTGSVASIGESAAAKALAEAHRDEPAGDGWEEDGDSIGSNAYQGPPTREMSASASVVSAPMSPVAGVGGDEHTPGGGQLPPPRVPTPEEDVDRTPNYPQAGMWLSEDYYIDGLGVHYRRVAEGAEEWEPVPTEACVRLVWADGVVQRVVMPGEDDPAEADATAAALSPARAREDSGVLRELAAAQASHSWERDSDARRDTPHSDQGQAAHEGSSPVPPAAATSTGSDGDSAAGSQQDAGHASPESAHSAVQQSQTHESAASDGWDTDSIVSDTGGADLQLPKPDDTARDNEQHDAANDGAPPSPHDSVAGESVTGVSDTHSGTASDSGSLPELPPTASLGSQADNGVLVHTGSQVGFAATHSDDASPTAAADAPNSDAAVPRSASVTSFERDAAALTREDMLALVAQQGVFLDEHVYVDQLLVQYERDASGEWQQSPPEAVDEAALREVLLARKRAIEAQEAATPAPVEDDSEEGTGGVSPAAGDNDAPNIPPDGLFISEQYFVDVLGAHWWMNTATGAWESVPDHKQVTLVWRGGQLVDTISPPQSEAGSQPGSEGGASDASQAQQEAALPAERGDSAASAGADADAQQQREQSSPAAVPDRTVTPPPDVVAPPPAMPAFFNPTAVTQAASVASEEEHAQPSAGGVGDDAAATSTTQALPPPPMTAFNPAALPPVDVGNSAAAAATGSSTSTSAPDFWEEARRAAESQRTSPVAPKETPPDDTKSSSAASGSFFGRLMPSWLGGSTAAADDEMPNWEEDRDPNELNPDKPPPIIPGFPGAPPAASAGDNSLDVSGVMGASPGPSPPSTGSTGGPNMFSLVGGAKGKKGKRTMPRWASTFPAGSSSAPVSAGVSPASSLGAAPPVSGGQGGAFNAAAAFSAGAQAALGAPPPPAAPVTAGLASTAPAHTPAALPEQPESVHSSSASGSGEDSDSEYQSDDAYYDAF